MESPLKPSKEGKHRSVSRAFAEITNKPLNNRTRGKKTDYYKMQNPSDLDSPPAKAVRKQKTTPPKKRSNRNNPKYLKNSKRRRSK